MSCVDDAKTFIVESGKLGNGKLGQFSEKMMNLGEKYNGGVISKGVDGINDYIITFGM